MAQGTLTIKLDNETKKEFNEFCEEIGINMTTAINMFIKKVIREQRIPFELSLNKPNLETLMAIEEAKRIAKDPNIKAYSSVEEVMKALEEE